MRGRVSSSGAFGVLVFGGVSWLLSCRSVVLGRCRRRSFRSCRGSLLAVWLAVRLVSRLVVRRALMRSFWRRWFRLALLLGFGCLRLARRRVLASGGVLRSLGSVPRRGLGRRWFGWLAAVFGSRCRRGCRRVRGRVWLWLAAVVSLAFSSRRLGLGVRSVLLVLPFVLGRRWLCLRVVVRRRRFRRCRLRVAGSRCRPVCLRARGVGPCASERGRWLARGVGCRAPLFFVAVRTKTRSAAITVIVPLARPRTLSCPELARRPDRKRSPQAAQTARDAVKTKRAPAPSARCITHSIRYIRAFFCFFVAARGRKMQRSSTTRKALGFNPLHPARIQFQLARTPTRRGGNLFNGSIPPYYRHLCPD